MRIYKGIGEMRTFIIKVPSSPTTIFFSFCIRFMNSESTLNFCSRANIHVIKEIILVFSQLILPLMSYTLLVTVHLKVLSNTMLFLQMSHLLQLVMELCLLFLGLGYFYGANNSFRFSFCLKMY